MGRNKQVVCQKCCRVMRSDHLNRHMKVHEKYNEKSLDSKSIYSSRTSLHKDDESEFGSSATDWEVGVLIFTKNSNFNGCQAGCHYTAKNKNFLLKKFFSSYHTAIAQSR